MFRPKGIERAVAWRLEREQKTKTIRKPDAYAKRIRQGFLDDPDELKKCLRQIDEAERKAAEEPERRMDLGGNPDLEGPAFLGFDADGRPLQSGADRDRLRSEDYHRPLVELEGGTPARLARKPEDAEYLKALRGCQLGARRFCRIDDWLRLARPASFSQLRVLERARPDILKELFGRVSRRLLEGDEAKGLRSLSARYGADNFFNLRPVQDELRQRTAIAIARAYDERGVRP